MYVASNIQKYDICDASLFNKTARSRHYRSCFGLSAVFRKHKQCRLQLSLRKYL